MDSPVVERYNHKIGRSEVIFDNVVYAQRAVDFREFDREKESILWETAPLDPWGEPRLVFNRSKILYLPDNYMTREYVSDLVCDNSFSLCFSQLKEAIVDESLPAQLIIGVDQDDYCIYGYDDIGRGWMIEMLGKFQYQPALPELREVALHDSLWGLRENAIVALGNLKGEEVASALCEKINDLHEHKSIRRVAARELYDHPYPESVDTLISAYEETADDKPKNMSEECAVQMGSWMPMVCMDALGQIPTLRSLEGIELGLYNYYEEIRHSAKLALDSWFEKNVSLLLKGFFGDQSEQREQLLRKLVFKYGAEEQKGFYDNIRL